MIEPEKVLVEAALDALNPYVQELRRRGWDSELRVDLEPPNVAERRAVVSLRVALPEFRVPVEADAAQPPPCLKTRSGLCDGTCTACPRKETFA